MINMQNIKKRYEVHARPDEEVEETHYTRDKDKGINVAKKVKVPYGYDVYFPNGNSMRVRTFEELQRLKFDNDANFVDMETGEEIQMETSLKQTVQRRATKASKPAATSSIDAS